MPAILPLALIALYFTPAALLGCRQRGYLALAVTMLALIGALAVTIRGLVLRLRGRRESAWWLATTIILILPAVLLLGPLG